MLKNIIKAGSVIICALLLQRTSFAAETVELPTEELATESVLPVFDVPVSVKNRNIVTEKRWNTDLLYSYSMTEPIANVSKFGLAVYYNFSEDSALGFLFAKNASGLSSYADQLRSQYSLDFSRAPQPLSTYMVDYNIKAFYGKMSLAKSIVLNTSMHGSLAGGITQYSHKSFPVIALGVGQKFYINKAWALRFDMRLYAGQAPIPFLNGFMRTTDPTPPVASQFDERITFSTSLDAGLSYLF